MKLIIEMDDKDYNRIKDIPDAFDSLTSRAYKSIKNGTPLPKGHERLIDADALIEWLELYDEWYNERFAKTPIKDIPMYYLGKRNRNDDVISILDRFLIVIEADKENKDEWIKYWISLFN